MEDQTRIKNVLNQFIVLRRANKIEDIMQFPQIADLEAKIEQLTGQGSVRQGYSGVNPETLPGVQVIKKQDKDIFFKINNSVSLSKVGEGTKWCTRFSYDNSPSMALSYLKENPYLIVIYRDGKPFVQYNPDLSQIKNVSDVELKPEAIRELNLPNPSEDLKSVPGMYVKAKMKFSSIYPERHLVTEDDIKQGIQDLKRMKAGYSQSSFLTTLLNVGIHIPELDQALLNVDQSLMTQPAITAANRYIDQYKGGEWPEYQEKFVSDNIRRIRYAQSTYEQNTSIGKIAKFCIHTKKRSPEFEHMLLTKNFGPIMGITAGQIIRPLRSRGYKEEFPGLEHINNYISFFMDGDWPEFDLKLAEYERLKKGPDKYKKENEYERRVATHIQNADHYFSLKPAISSFVSWALKQRPRRRYPDFEKAIIEKDFTKALKNSPVGRSRVSLPGWYSLINYATNIIGGPWPEFEAKIHSHPKLAVDYYYMTGFKPPENTPQIIKDIIYFSRFIKQRPKSEIITQEFEHAIKHFLLQARKELRYSKFTPVIYNVLIPYIKKSGKKLKDIFGGEVAHNLTKNKGLTYSLSQPDI